DLDEEFVDLANDVHELFEANGFGDVGVRMESVTAKNVFLSGRGGQDNDGDMAQVRIGFDLFKQLVAVVLRQVQVEQNQIGPWHALVRSTLIQIIETFLPVACDTQSVVNLVVFEGFPSDEDVSGIVFDEQDLDWATCRCHRWAPSVAPTGVWSRSAATGKVNQNREPLLWSVSIPMVPPCNSTIFLHTASPIPVPVYASRPCRRWKITNTLSANSGAMPMPLSATLNIQ